MDYYDLGPYGRAITTSAEEAQLWFDRGLNWLFGYNHGEAVNCFKKASEADPDCAMATPRRDARKRYVTADERREVRDLSC